MPLPTPNNRESRGDFVSRCIGILNDKGEMKDNQQRIAVCYTQWKEAKASAIATVGNGDNETIISSVFPRATKEQSKIKANGEESVEQLREEYLNQAKQVMRELLSAANKVAAFLEDEAYCVKATEAWVFQKMVASKAMICAAERYIEFGENEDETEREDEEEKGETVEQESTENIGLIEPESAKIISEDYIREKIYNNKWGAPTY
jgi:ElaB/YqjD/DUF883 family membrane-anchored ribosome-binding protein